MDSEEKTAPHGMQIMVGCALFGAMLFALHSVADVFTPLFLALTLVLTMRPITRKLRSYHVPGWLAATVSFLALVILFSGVVSLLIWAFTPVPQTLINYSANFENTLTAALNFLESKGVRTADLSIYLNQLNFNSVISWAWNLLDSLRSVGGLLAIVIVALLFFTVDTTTLFSRSTITRRTHSHIAQALEGFEKRVRHYWIISTVFGLIVAVIDVFALTILGVPLPLTWGMWAFITNYIPNLGFVIGVIPPMMMGLVDSGWQTLVWVMVLYSVINVVIQTFIQPKLTGDVVGLSPSVTFVSLVLWTSVVGWLGSLLAVPLTLFFKALLVDSDPRTQWLDVFLISEGDARRREKAGLYEPDPPADAADVDFHPTGSLPSLNLPHRKNRQQEKSQQVAGGRKRQEVSRQLAKWSARVRRLNVHRPNTRAAVVRESEKNEAEAGKERD